MMWHPHFFGKAADVMDKGREIYNEGDVVNKVLLGVADGLRMLSGIPPKKEFSEDTKSIARLAWKSPLRAVPEEIDALAQNPGCLDPPGDETSSLLPKVRFQPSSSLPFLDLLMKGTADVVSESVWIATLVAVVHSGREADVYEWAESQFRQACDSFQTSGSTDLIRLDASDITKSFVVMLTSIAANKVWRGLLIAPSTSPKESIFNKPLNGRMFASSAWQELLRHYGAKGLPVYRISEPPEGFDFSSTPLGPSRKLFVTLQDVQQVVEKITTPRLPAFVRHPLGRLLWSTTDNDARSHYSSACMLLRDSQPSAAVWEKDCRSFRLALEYLKIHLSKTCLIPFSNPAENLKGLLRLGESLPNASPEDICAAVTGYHCANVPDGSVVAIQTPVGLFTLRNASHWEWPQWHLFLVLLDGAQSGTVVSYTHVPAISERLIELVPDNGQESVFAPKVRAKATQPSNSANHHSTEVRGSIFCQGNRLLANCKALDNEYVNIDYTRIAARISNATFASEGQLVCKHYSDLEQDPTLSDTDEYIPLKWFIVSQCIEKRRSPARADVPWLYSVTQDYFMQILSLCIAERDVVIWTGKCASCLQKLKKTEEKEGMDVLAAGHLPEVFIPTAECQRKLYLASHEAVIFGKHNRNNLVWKLLLTLGCILSLVSLCMPSDQKAGAKLLQVCASGSFAVSLVLAPVDDSVTSIQMRFWTATALTYILLEAISVSKDPVSLVSAILCSAAIFAGIFVEDTPTDQALVYGFQSGIAGSAISYYISSRML